MSTGWAGTMKNQKGLMLVELITVLVLIGIIGTFATFFLYLGVNSYVNTKTASEGALDAQMALDRITLELRDLNYFTSAPVITGDASLSYKSAVLAGTRMLKYDSAAHTIALNIAGQDYRLLENLSSFNLSVTAKDLNYDGVDDVAAIELEFNLDGIGKDFKTVIFPRYMVKNK